MKVTFDTNVWQIVVNPERFPKNINYKAAKIIHSAITQKRVEPYLCETVVILEGVPKNKRLNFLYERDRASITFETLPSEGNTIHTRVSIGGFSDSHPGWNSALADKLEEAFSFGFKYLPTSRFGTIRPIGFEKYDQFRIPLSDNYKNDIWPLLDRIAAINEEIEQRGFGRRHLENIAKRIQARRGKIMNVWHDGLSHPKDQAERKEIEKGFAEWADGDTVGAHYGYSLDVICTEDEASGRTNSIFSKSSKDWLKNDFGIEIWNMEKLANSVKTD